MRKTALFAPALLAACATAPAQPVPGDMPKRTCNEVPAAQFVGQPGNSQSGAAILRATGAAVLRWAPPGAMMTMEFRPDRVTVYLAADYRITKVDCG